MYTRGKSEGGISLISINKECYKRVPITFEVVIVISR